MGMGMGTGTGLGTGVAVGTGTFAFKVQVPFAGCLTPLKKNNNKNAGPCGAQSHKLLRF